MAPGDRCHRQWAHACCHTADGSAWAEPMNGHQRWTTKTSQLQNGELLTVTATDPEEIPASPRLGFIGLLAIGAHRQMHHLMMAKGELDYEHLASQQ